MYLIFIENPEKYSLIKLLNSEKYKYIRYLIILNWGIRELRKRRDGSK